MRGAEVGITEQGRNALIEKIKGKKVLYVATKNDDYIRLQQEINLIRQYSAENLILVSSSPNYIKRILHVYRLLLTTSLKSYDIIFVGFMVQMIIPLWSWKFRGKTVIIDFFISIYDTLVDDRKKIKGNSIVAKVLHKLDYFSIKSADYVICDTKAHAKYFDYEFSINEERAIVLYLEADTSIYHPMKTEKPEQWKNKYLVIYFGSILPVQGVDIVIDAIERLKSEKNIHFLIVGPIGTKIRKPLVENVTYINWLSQKELAEYISFCDLCLAGHFSSTVGKANRTIPGKAYIYQAMGKKMILGDSDANHELFNNHEYIFVPLGNSLKLAETILKLYKTYYNTGERWQWEK